MKKSKLNEKKRALQEENGKQINKANIYEYE